SPSPHPFVVRAPPILVGPTTCSLRVQYVDFDFQIEVTLNNLYFTATNKYIRRRKIKPQHSRQRKQQTNQDSFIYKNKYTF
ncbi:MAG: hypothetical protein ACI8RD_001218, partial [Bacillariaceae sp.]